MRVSIWLRSGSFPRANNRSGIHALCDDWPVRAVRLADTHAVLTHAGRLLCDAIGSAVLSWKGQAGGCLVVERYQEQAHSPVGLGRADTPVRCRRVVAVLGVSTFRWVSGGRTLLSAVSVWCGAQSDTFRWVRRADTPVRCQCVVRCSRVSTLRSREGGHSCPLSVCGAVLRSEHPPVGLGRVDTPVRCQCVVRCSRVSTLRWVSGGRTLLSAVSVWCGAQE